MKNGHAVVLVSNDLTFDQRVRKTSATLEELGWRVSVLGRLMPDSKEVPWTHHAKRVRLPFHRGVGFYSTLQIAFFWKLLWKKEVDVIWANDLDTLLPAHLVGFMRRIPVVYDSHEYFTEAEGLTGRPFQRSVWLALEKWLLPKQLAVITVNDGIADAYAQRYPKGRFGRPMVIRNMPVKRQVPVQKQPGVWKQWGVPTDLPIAILQGAFMDRDRGAKLAVESLAFGTGWRLVLVGAGPEFDWAQAQQNQWNGRLHCIPKLPFEELAQLTASSDIGLSLDLGVHGNFYMSLPNKLFDYIHACIPVIATSMPEVKRIIEEFDVGQILNETSPSALAQAIESMIDVDPVQIRARCSFAAEQLHWESDSKNIHKAIMSVF